MPNAAETKQPASSARSAARKPIRHWHDLPVAGKIAVVAAPVVALVGIIGAVIGFDSGNDGSSAPARADNQDDTFAETLKNQYGITVDGDTAADIANVACSSPIQGVGLYNAQQELAQRYPDINRTNPNAVGVAMSAAVLVYCPERLP